MRTHLKEYARLCSLLGIEPLQISKVYHLIMTIEPYQRNTTALFMSSLYTKDIENNKLVIVLPERLKHYAETYPKEYFNVFIYNEEAQYSKIDWLGLKPRNTGATGRAGMVEAITSIGDKNGIYMNYDDDLEFLVAKDFPLNSKINLQNSRWQHATFDTREELDLLAYLMYYFKRFLKIEIGLSDGVNPFYKGEILHYMGYPYQIFVTGFNEIEQMRWFNTALCDDLQYSTRMALNGYQGLTTGALLKASELVANRETGNGGITKQTKGWLKLYAGFMISAITKMGILKTRKTENDNQFYFHERVLNGVKKYPAIILVDEQGKYYSQTLGKKVIFKK